MLLTSIICQMDIAKVFSDEQWNGYHIVSPTWYIVDSGYQNGAFFPVIMKKGEQNVLCVLENKEGAWLIAFTNEHALYSGDTLPNNVTYYINPDAVNIYDDYKQDFDIFYEYGSPLHNIKMICYFFAYINKQWRLRSIQIIHPEIEGSYVGGKDYRETYIRPSDGFLTYSYTLNEKDVLPNNVLEYSSSYLLKDFDIDSIPLSYGDSPF